MIEVEDITRRITIVTLDRINGIFHDFSVEQERVVENLYNTRDIFSYSHDGMIVRVTFDRRKKKAEMVKTEVSFTVETAESGSPVQFNTLSDVYVIFDVIRAGGDYLSTEGKNFGTLGYYTTSQSAHDLYQRESIKRGYPFVNLAEITEP